jgi:formylglycine-generating enzyme required for sulfatase activity
MSYPLLPPQRLELIRLVNRLSSTEFGELLFALNPPEGIVPSGEAAQGDRAKALMSWVEGPTGCGLAIFLEMLDAIAPGTFKVQSQFPSSQATSPVTTPSLSDSNLNRASELAITPLLSNPSFSVDLGAGVLLDMVRIPAGCFLMGEPDWKGYHNVNVPQFYMGKYPVTQRQWRTVSRFESVARKLDQSPSRFKGDDLPVERVAWIDAVEFCKRLSKQVDHEYRLPSEAEWEYACRAGTTTAFYFGDNISQELANYTGSDALNFFAGFLSIKTPTEAVGRYPPNSFGLYDMHGNVSELCQDVWHGTYEGAPTDGSAWVEGGNQKLRVHRGGSWGSDPWQCRSAYRANVEIDGRYLYFGFRVCCSVPENS